MDGGVYLDSAQRRDWMLVKMALEGKDYQTARKEAEGLEPPGTSDTGSDLQSRSLPQGDVILEISTLEVVHAEGRIDTPSGSLTFEATRVTATRLTAAGRLSTEPQPKDPLVVDLSGAGPTTTGAKGARNFDLEGSGQQGATSFVSGDTAFPALDRNLNGTIDSGLELFGDQHCAAQGFEELAKFDSDGNRSIDALDPVFGSLRLLHGDGHLTSLADHGITALSLEAQASPGLTGGGDIITHSATAQGTGGATYGTYALLLQHWDQVV